MLQQLLNAQGGDTTLHAVAAVVRAVLFGAMLLLVGGVFFVLLVWPGGGDDGRTKRVLWGAAIVGALTTALSMGLEGADIAGLGITHALSIAKALDTLDTSFGQAALARLALFALFAALVTQLGRRRASTAFTAAVGVVSTALLLTLSLAGHARTGRWVNAAIPLDIVHLLAAAVWIGGLAVLALLVLPRAGAGDERIVARFSTVAFVCVGVIAATGAVQGIRQLHTFHALRTTDYGRFLIVKVVLVAVVALLGGMGRSLLRARQRDELDDDELRRTLRRTVSIESALAVAVLAVTSLLVAANPASSSAATGFSASRLVSGTVIEVAALPTRPGPITMHFYASDTSTTLTTPFAATAELSLPSKGITNVNVPLQVTGHAHWTAYNVDVPIRGTWQLVVHVTIGEGTSRVATFSIPIA